MSTYGRVPVRFERGAGAWLRDHDGNEFLDALGGIAVCVLGHAHPDVTRAISEQAARLIHTSNIYEIEAQETLADRLAAVSGMHKMFFCNSGAEANETALKLARLHGHARGSAAPQVVVVDGAFHGRTLATLSASGGTKVHQGFDPLVPGFVRVAFDDLGALEAVAATHPDIAAVLVEPILGEGGVVVPAKGYLAGVRALCDRHDWLMMLDEVQTGMGRTGQWFAWQDSGCAPDVMTLAKGLANGLPIGACLARGAAAELFAPGMHGSTFGGNPLACTVAGTVIDVIERDGLCEHAQSLGARLQRVLGDELTACDHVVQIRGRGFMLGIEMDRPCADVAALALQRGLLVNVTAERVIRLLPPLILSEREADEVAGRLCDAIRAFHNQ